jgi:hypothetical protein
MVIIKKKTAQAGKDEGKKKPSTLLVRIKISPTTMEISIMVP